MKNGYCITHEYAGYPAINSRHRTLEAAQAKIEMMRRSFRAYHSSNFPTRAIFPHALRELVNGESGEIVVSTER